MILRFEHVEHVRAERLVGHHHPRAGRKRLAVGIERRSGPMHLNAGVLQRLDELGRRRKIVLRAAQDIRARVTVLRLPEFGHVAIVGDRTADVRCRAAARSTGTIRFGARRRTILRDLRDHRIHTLGRDRPVVLRPVLDLVGPHHPAIEQERFTIARGEIEERVVRRDRVIDRLPEMPFLRRNRHRQASRAQLAIGYERDADRRRITDRLGENADLIVVIAHGAHATVPPSAVVRAGAEREPRLVLQHEAMVERGTDQVEARDHGRVKPVVGRIAVRRRGHDRAGRAGLVVVVHDLRVPFHEQLLRHVARFGQRIHVGVTVVVVARILLVQARNVRVAAQLVGFLHVPVGHELHAVRIRMRHENDAVVQDPHRLVVGAAGELVERLHELLRTKHLGGMQAAVNPEHHLAFLRELRRFGGVETVGHRQPVRDFLIAGQILQVRGRRHDGHDLRPSFLGQADRVENDTVTLLRDGGEEGVQLGVVGELVVGADVMPEEFLG